MSRRMIRSLSLFVVVLFLAACESQSPPQAAPNTASVEAAKPAAAPAGTAETAKPAASPAGTAETAKPAASPAGTETAKPAAAPASEGPKKEPDYITVQHILIGFKGSVGKKPITRSREEAKKLAEGLFKRAKAGEDFDALVKEYTDDSHPGIYKMANNGVRPPRGVYPRGGMVRAFGDVGFPLEVGGIGMAPHDGQTSPFGWHIIKRLE